jgi:hypothetical protein
MPWRYRHSLQQGLLSTTENLMMEAACQYGKQGMKDACGIVAKQY